MAQMKAFVHEVAELKTYLIQCPSFSVASIDGIMLKIIIFALCNFTEWFQNVSLWISQKVVMPVDWRLIPWCPQETL